MEKGDKLMGKRRKTAVVAEPFPGDKPYQQQAEKALPILVRQALANKSIFYSELAAELGMYHRNLNYVLGSIGQTLKKLSEEWSEEIPPIQCLVINKRKKLPGEGVGWFITGKEDFRKLPLKQRRWRVELELQKVFAYNKKWERVLQRFGIKPATPSYKEILSKASRFRAGGESKHHRKLKHFIARHPEIVKLPAGVGTGQTEYHLPSGDSLDVLFAHRGKWVGVEVKSKISPVEDVYRGIFQCVKYKAVIEACQVSQEIPPNARAVLILESEFPKSLLPLKHMLDVEVIDNVKSE
jgi:hypothetical protein